jgi:hypothetical protein
MDATVLVDVQIYIIVGAANAVLAKHVTESFKFCRNGGTEAVHTLADNATGDD